MEREYMTKAKYIIMMMVATLLWGSCTSDEQPAMEAESLQLLATEEPWKNEEVRWTRSTLTDMQASTYAGFGLNCNEFNLTNEKVTWNSTTQKWSYINMKFWPQPVKTASFYAYAPWTDLSTTPASGITAVNGNVLTFNPSTADNATDLLWASHENLSREQRTATLNFQHALAKISFGSLTNNTGETLTLKSISISGTIYTEGDLSLSDGTWSNQPASAETVTRSGSDISDYTPFMVIPKDGVSLTMTITFSLTTTTEHTATYTKTHNLRAGQNYEFNITIDKNFEVVIEN